MYVDSTCYHKKYNKKMTSYYVFTVDVVHIKNVYIGKKEMVFAFERYPDQVTFLALLTEGIECREDEYKVTSTILTRQDFTQSMPSNLVFYQPSRNQTNFSEVLKGLEYLSVNVTTIHEALSTWQFSDERFEFVGQKNRVAVCSCNAQEIIERMMTKHVSSNAPVYNPPVGSSKKRRASDSEDSSDYDH
jgi:UDP-N-acetylmuramoylalanine-D-glutamate ligase